MPYAKYSDGREIRDVLSSPRMSTYLAATQGDPDRALQLYGWNARVSAALMVPAHFAEVATRNAVSDALTNVYGANWPWEQTFQRSVPTSARGYDARSDLISNSRRQPTTGKVIAELKFVFWQKMFTARHDARLWNHQILLLFPNAHHLSAARLRNRVYDDLDAIRQLRNRVAHHEPIFSRPLANDLAKILDLVALRSTPTAAWVHTLEEVSAVLSTRP